MKWIIGILVSALLLTWAFYGIDLKPLVETFANIVFWPIFLMILSIFAFFSIKAVRWKLLLLPIGKFSSKSLVPSILIGTAVNYLFFGYVGEILRAWLLSKKSSYKKGPILTTIFLERLFDFWTLLFLLWVSTYLTPSISSTVVRTGQIAFLFGLIATVFAIMLVIWPKRMLKIFQWCSQILPLKWQHFLMHEIEMAIKGLTSISDLKLLLSIILASIIQWSLICLCNWFATIAVGIHVPPWALISPMGLMVIGMALPTSPGQFGVIELSYVLGLSYWQVSKEEALAAGLLYHFVLYSSVITTAFVMSRRLGISWKKPNNSE